MRALRDIPRNVDDTLIRRIAKSGGVVGISFYVGHLVSGAEATLDDVVAHAEHLRSVGGPAVTALGSDFEGGIVPPRDAKTIASLPALAQKLRDRGWPERDVRALFHDNAARVLARCP
jgi:membrane dipeptidase